MTVRQGIDCDAPSLEFGPRPPQPTLAPTVDDRRRVPSWALLAGITVATMAVVIGAVAVVLRQGASPAAAAAFAARRAEPPCRGELTRHGCSTGVVWTAPVLTTDGTRYRLGQPGDVLLVGDWTCAGHDAPALYRPGTGEVFLFSGWASTGTPVRAVSRTSSGRRHQRPVVVRGQEGCDHVVVKAAENT